MHLCSVLALVASALGLFGVAKVGLRPLQTSSARQPEGQEKPWAQQRWDEAMKTRRECKAKCMGDEFCSEQCPKPWLFLQEKCDTAKPIWDCHKQCGHDHSCHKQCPLPKCPKAAEKVKAVLQCHGKCGDDRECHYTCGRPFSEFQAACKSFDEVSTCHKACVPGDHACHANCPKISWPAAAADHQHHGHEHGKFQQPGSWHHHEHGSWHNHEHGSWHNRTHGDWHHHGHDHNEHHHHGNSSFDHLEHYHHGNFSFHHHEHYHHGNSTFHHHENHHHGNSGFHQQEHHHHGYSSSHNHEHRHHDNSNFDHREHYDAQNEHHHIHDAHQDVGGQYFVV